MLHNAITMQKFDAVKTENMQYLEKKIQAIKKDCYKKILKTIAFILFFYLKI